MPKRTLLIIGNGFDLKCGLNTRYIDYWRYQRKNHPSFDAFVKYLEDNSFNSFEGENLDILERIIEIEEGVTFLDYYFTLYDWRIRRLDKDKVWSNIEDMLLYGLTDTGSFKAFNFEGCYSCFLQTKDKERNDSFFYDSYAHLIISIYLSKVFCKKPIGEARFNDYIISEINSFSICFSNYINEQVKENSTYYELAQNLISKITNASLNECEIVSFNYTEPICGPNLANIHGIASKRKIVMGVTCGDGSKKETTHHSWYYKATKEYKIASVSASGIKVSANYEDITDIYVYGLSLGKQDYDFFDNLFDEFEFLMRIYKAKIHFCFSTYAGKTKDEVAEETTSRVTELINYFGDHHKSYGLLRSMIQKGHLLFDFIE